MEALRSNTTSIPLYRTDILAPAPTETLYPQTDQQLATAELTMTVGVHHFSTEQPPTWEAVRPQTLADVIKRETTAAWDVPTILLPAHKAPAEDTAAITAAQIHNETPPERATEYVGIHRADSPTPEKTHSPWRQRIAKAAGAAMVASVLAAAGPAPKAEAATTPITTQAEASVTVPAGMKLVATGGEAIMGVSPRQKEIINSIPGLDDQERSALARYTVGVHKVTKQLNGVNPNVMLAQAAHESNLSKSGLANRDHNLFGMKGDYKGKSALWKTWEEVKGKAVRITAKFKKYPSEAESMKDYIDQQHRLPWYQDAVQHDKNVPHRDDGDYLDHILNEDEPGQHAYATDSKYKDKILDKIERLRIHELTKIDKTPVRKVLVPLQAEIKKAAGQPEISRATKISKMKTLIARFAWPNYRSAHTDKAMQRRPAYAEAMEDASYTGGYNGIDCGAFVTAVMRESGADPNYNSQNGNTYDQKRYLESHDDVNVKSGQKVIYHQIKPNEKLRPGDIAIKSNGRGTVGHTFFYVGKNQPGLDTNGEPTDFKGVLASASLGGRAPMASNDYNRSNYQWFRLK